MTFDKKWRFPPKIILSRIQFSTEKHDRLSLTDDSCHSQCATDEATKQENSMFSNGTKRTGSIAPDTMLISVFDLTTAVFPAREVQLTWRAAGCFSTPSHLLLSLRKLSRGKPPHAAAGWILIPVLWICIGKKKKKKREGLMERGLSVWGGIVRRCDRAGRVTSSSPCTEECCLQQRNLSKPNT